MWLLDANIDIRIRDILTEAGIESRTAESLGWRQLSNGDLVTVAVRGGFSCLLTRDQAFAESAARALRQFPHFAIVVVQLKQQKWPEYGDQFRREWVQAPIVPVEGTTIAWPATK